MYRSKVVSRNLMYIQGAFVLGSFSFLQKVIFTRFVTGIPLSLGLHLSGIEGQQGHRDTTDSFRIKGRS
jgi:hypothetical protein